MAGTDPRTIIDETPMVARQWIVIVLMVLLNALDGFDVLSSAFASPGISKEWGIPRSELGLVLSAELVGMGFGTAGPGPQAEVLDPALMLVPLAAFDARGHRIGYGAGYYDRAIENLRWRGFEPRLVGIAFDCQEVGLVPDEPHDVVIPEILTETGLRRLG